MAGQSRCATKLSDAQKSMVRARIETITAEYYQSANRLEADFRRERKRLEDMLRDGSVSQTLRGQ